MRYITVGPYTRKDGVRVKRHKRPDTGRRGRTPPSQRVLPKLEAGKLPGYHPSSQNLEERRKALDKLTRGASADKVLKLARRVQVLANYTSRSQPRNAGKYRSDAKYLFKLYHKLKQ